ncbi:glucosamine-6-phosphate isomerase [Salinicoccus jeotgali]|uniref:Glucosamine-6-phosphate isomerase n=1 Tax=Salinicoccus jeotgali TaxID=381634 RepID=A0ABP7EQ04_9STAP
MAMNFKIFKDKTLVNDYIADIIRKQIHNNPTSVLGLEMSSELEGSYGKLVEESKEHPANYSQIYIVAINRDGNTEVFNELDIPESQLKLEGTKESMKSVLDDKKQANLTVLSIGANKKIGYNNVEGNEQLFESREMILVATGNDKAKAVRDLYDAAENGQEDFAKVKKHRMVTVVMDSEAASQLDHDIVDYYTSEFA